MNIDDVTPAIFLKNEVYWVYYVVRDLLNVFGRLVVLDTGSIDGTKDLIQRTAQEIGSQLMLTQVEYGHNAYSIGNAPNLLREMVATEWMFLCGGDEIWLRPQLMALLESDIPEGCTVGMVRGRNVEAVEGQLVERDSFSADRLFNPNTVWVRCKYPFEDHGLNGKLHAGQVHYLNGNDVYFWHVRHLRRSPMDGDTYHRFKKRGYFPYTGPKEPIPPDWLGEVRDDIYNPYLGNQELVGTH